MIPELRNLFRRKRPNPNPPPASHNFTKERLCWGHNYMINKIIDGGLKLEATGWKGGIKEGDFFLLTQTSREVDVNPTTRYKVARIRYFVGPSDMWVATLEFAPRVNQTKERIDDRQNDS